MSYVKLNLELLKDVGDIRQTAILCFLLYQPKEDIKVQQWKQSYLAEILKCERKSISRDLKKLHDGGWLTYRESNYKQLRTTEITLTEKALKYIEEKNTKNHQNTINKDILAKKRVAKISRTQEYLNEIMN